MVLLKSIATIMGLSIILVFRSRYYWRYTMRSITTRYERRLQLECYRFIRKIHKPTWRICKSSTWGSMQGVAELNLAQLLNAQDFHHSTHSKWFGTSCASTTRGRLWAGRCFILWCSRVFGIIRQSPVCGDCLIKVVVSTVNWLVRYCSRSVIAGHGEVIL